MGQARQMSSEPHAPDRPDADGASAAQEERSAVGDLVARATSRPADDSSSRGERARDLGRLTRAMAGSARTAGRASVLGGGWLVDLMLDTAPADPGARRRDAALAAPRPLRRRPGPGPDLRGRQGHRGCGRCRRGPCRGRVRRTADPADRTRPARGRDAARRRRRGQADRRAARGVRGPRTRVDASAGPGLPRRLVRTSGHRPVLADGPAVLPGSPPRSGRCASGWSDEPGATSPRWVR